MTLPALETPPKVSDSSVSRRLLNLRGRGLFVRLAIPVELTAKVGFGSNSPFELGYKLRESATLACRMSRPVKTKNASFRWRFLFGNDQDRYAFCINGILRMRLPESAATALAIAGITSGTPTSPRPPGEALLCTKVMSICGTSLMRSIA
jgi:hypothetical protein